MFLGEFLERCGRDSEAARALHPTQRVWTLNGDLKFSKVREKRVCADPTFSTCTCTTKTRDQRGCPLLDPCNLPPRSLTFAKRLYTYFM